MNFDYKPSGVSKTFLIGCYKISLRLGPLTEETLLLLKAVYEKRLIGYYVLKLCHIFPFKDFILSCVSWKLIFFFFEKLIQKEILGLSKTIKGNQMIIKWLQKGHRRVKHIGSNQTVIKLLKVVQGCLKNN